MRAGWHARGVSEEGRVNVTPLIDVVMCLIVFYLMVGHLVLQRRGEIDLPETRFGETVPSEGTDPLTISVNADSIEIDGVELDTERVASVVAGRLAREPGLPVRVRADREVSYGRVSPVLTALRDAGAERVELATRQAVPGGNTGESQ
ncbi:MAG: ExbD/TolR family protein [Phycisphaerales bacterium JB040]